MENRVKSRTQVAIASILLCMTACANNSLEQRLAPDPQLQTSPPTTPTPQTGGEVTLPVSFPLVIPVYPEAELTKVENEGKLSYWRTANSPDRVKEYYQEQLKVNNWQITSSSTDKIVGDRSDLKLTIAFVSPITNTSSTEFTLSYETKNATANPTSSPSGSPASNDLSKVSPQLRGYIEDLVALGAISDRTKSTDNLGFNPNSSISRRQYAHWLFNSNNQIQSDRPSQQIRPASPDAQPVFKDIPKSDRDFGIIQGLAEAGIIPSSLSGDTTATLFRPDAPLTREQLLLWKVPLDTRQALPKASAAAVQQTWGFQDATKIAPEAAKAVIADFQNGEKANITRAFGFTTLFQPKKPVTHAEAMATIWYFGAQGEGRSAKEALQIQSQPVSPTPTPGLIPTTPPTVPTAIDPLPTLPTEIPATSPGTLPTPILTPDG
jgi:hypothetical protein